MGYRRHTARGGQRTTWSLGSVDICRVDVTQDDAVGTATRSTMSEFGRIDILVNNAGITGGNAVTWELDPSAWRRVIEVNLVAP